MRWIDTHVHLDSAKFDSDRDAVIERAKEAHVMPLVAVGADLASSRAAVELADCQPGIYATVGVHPHDARNLDRYTLGALRDLATHPRVVALGEMGLDYYYEFSPLTAQRQAFELQLSIAEDLGKPVVIHLRDKRGQTDAYDDALGVLVQWVQSGPERAPAKRDERAPGVLHCFSGTRDFAHALLNLGFYVGVDGPITYPNARELQALVAELPLDRLLLETDCPYLAPQPRRGRRNEPAYLAFIGEKVAELQGIDVSAVASVTTSNAVTLFGLDDWDIPQRVR